MTSIHFTFDISWYYSIDSFQAHLSFIFLMFNICINFVWFSGLQTVEASGCFRGKKIIMAPYICMQKVMIYLQRGHCTMFCLLEGQRVHQCLQRLFCFSLSQLRDQPFSLQFIKKRKNLISPKSHSSNKGQHNIMFLLWPNNLTIFYQYFNDINQICP